MSSRRCGTTIVADRTRNRFVGQVDVVPTEALTFSLSGGFGSDEFGDSYFGLQDAGFKQRDAQRRLHGGERPRRRRQLRLRTLLGPGSGRGLRVRAQTEQQDPNRDWTVDSTEQVHYFSIYVTPPRIGANTEVRLSYEYAHARGNFFYVVGPALATPFPTSCRKRSTSSRISGSTCAIG